MSRSGGACSDAAGQRAAGWHLLIEATKLAYSDLHRYNADPAFEAIPTESVTLLPRIPRPQAGQGDAELGSAHLENVEHLQRREALARGRQLMDVVAVVIR